MDVIGRQPSNNIDPFYLQYLKLELQKKAV